jgi:hypothetical protein
MQAGIQGKGLLFFSVFKKTLISTAGFCEHQKHQIITSLLAKMFVQANGKDRLDETNSYFSQYLRKHLKLNIKE